MKIYPRFEMNGEVYYLLTGGDIGDLQEFEAEYVREKLELATKQRDSARQDRDYWLKRWDELNIEKQGSESWRELDNMIKQKEDLRRKLGEYFTLCVERSERIKELEAHLDTMTKDRDHWRENHAVAVAWREHYARLWVAETSDA